MSMTLDEALRVAEQISPLPQVAHEALQTLRREYHRLVNLPERDAYTSVPILADFRNQHPIGELRVLTEHLPSTPNFVFSLGYKAESTTSAGEIPDSPYVGSYQLLAVALVSDSSYLGYLRQINGRHRRPRHHHRLRHAHEQLLVLRAGWVRAG